MARDSQKPTPAIVRDVCDKDSPTRKSTQPLDSDNPEKIISQPTDTVSHRRGWGDSGYKVQVVQHDCPACNFDRMVRRIDVSPELPNEVRYWCLNPNCVHYASDAVSYACKGSYPQRTSVEPAVFEESDA